MRTPLTKIVNRKQKPCFLVPLHRFQPTTNHYYYEFIYYVPFTVCLFFDFFFFFTIKYTQFFRCSFPLLFVRFKFRFHLKHTLFNNYFQLRLFYVLLLVSFISIFLIRNNYYKLLGLQIERLHVFQKKQEWKSASKCNNKNDDQIKIDIE